MDIKLKQLTVARVTPPSSSKTFDSDASWEIEDGINIVGVNLCAEAYPARSMPAGFIYTGAEVSLAPKFRQDGAVIINCNSFVEVRKVGFGLFRKFCAIGEMCKTQTIFFPVGYEIRVAKGEFVYLNTHMSNRIGESQAGYASTIIYYTKFEEKEVI